MPTQSLIAALVHANKTNTSFAPAAALMPASLDEAMAVQAATMEALGAKTGGWKVGITAEGVPMAGPMIAEHIVASGGSWPLTAAGPILAEVEIAVRFKHDLPPRPDKPYTRAELINGVDAVLAGIELICSRLRDGSASPFPLWLADRLGNAGYICGAPVHEFRKLDLAALRTRLWVDGKLVHDKTGGHPQNDPLAPILAIVNAQTGKPAGIKAGQTITTGSLIVPLRCDHAQKLEAEIEGLGKVSVAITAA